MTQGPAPGQPYIPAVPGIGPQPRDERAYGREHCDHLRRSEYDIRDRLAYAPPPYSEERQRLEYQLHEVRDGRERCGDSLIGRPMEILTSPRSVNPALQGGVQAICTARLIIVRKLTMRGCWPI
jgi:hypothetical protein